MTKDYRGILGLVTASSSTATGDAFATVTVTVAASVPWCPSPAV